MQGHDEDMSELDEGDAPAVDMFAALFEARGWPCELAGEDELAAEVKGSWTSYQLRVIAREDDNVVQILVLPDITVPEDLRVRMYEAVGLINEQLWLGHFDLWSAPKWMSAKVQLFFYAISVSPTVFPVVSPNLQIVI